MSWNKVNGELEIYKFDGVSVSAIYKGAFDRLEPAKLEWHEEEKSASTLIDYPLKHLTLNEIVEQIGEDELITVFVESPLHGEIYQYGNYADGKWWQIGETMGYA